MAGAEAPGPELEPPPGPAPGGRVPRSPERPAVPRAAERPPGDPPERPAEGNRAVKSGRLSPEERADIERLAARGLKAGQIAQRIDRHAGTIHYHMTMLGYVQPTARSFAYTRNGHEVRSFSSEEDAFIEHLRISGLTIAEIRRAHAEHFGSNRAHNSIACRLAQLAGRQEAAE